MLTLTLMRHAHSPYSPSDDFNRKLSLEGEQQARDAGEKIKQIQPQLALISPSNRTVKTFDIMNEYIQLDNIVTEQAIYNGEASTLLELISLSDAYKVQNILLLGHNPTISTLSHLLQSETTEMLHMMQPAQYHILSFNIEKWSDITPYSATLNKMH